MGTSESKESSLLPLVGLTANELAFALFLVGLVYLAVSLPALGRAFAKLGGGGGGARPRGEA